MIHRQIHLVLGIVLLTLLAASYGDAQTRSRVDNRGRDFRIAFLLTNGEDGGPELSLDIAAEQPTAGTLTYVRSGRVIPISITQSNVAVRIKLDTSELILPDPNSFPISNFTVHLQFNDEVVVYGMNTQRFSSDNFLALPYEVLGTEHIIISYPNTIDPNSAAAGANASDFPSQFAVVATEDNTQVTIQPTVRLKGRPDVNPFTINLNAGEIYFAQANGRAGIDVSGTSVRSNRRVVVYGSHQRTNIPWDEAVGRNHLIEQLPPVNRWANRAIITPMYELEKTVHDPNIFRVLAAKDNTQIFFDSTLQTTLNARQYMEFKIDGPKLITATGPILVTEYHHSSVNKQYISQPNDSIGDPFMMLIPAQEQFDSVYWFESYASPHFVYHYVNVVIPTERVSSLQLDGFPVSVPFTRINKTSYSYAQIPVQLGYHKMNARAPFGLYMYGYGAYDGYGAPGALVFDSLFKDQREPSLSWQDSCGGVAGYALDDGPLDFGVESMRLLGGSSNVRLEIDPFKPGKDSVHFRIPLIDPYQDGQAEVMVVDTAGLDRHYTFPVKGFTVAMVVGQTAPIPLDTLASLNGLEFCRTITLTNYGAYPQTIKSLNFGSAPPGLRVLGGFPMEIEPGGSRSVTICYQHAGDTAFAVNVNVDNGCDLRWVATLPLISGIDSTVPVVQQQYGPCDSSRTFSVLELGALNSGVASITLLDSANLTFSYSPELPSKQVQVRLDRRDPYQDMYYKVLVTDAVGNSTTISDLVGGFTISVQNALAQQVGLRVARPWLFGNLTYGDGRCDTFYLRNYGRLPLVLERPRIVGNLNFSIPPEQLPIILKPGEIRPLEVCFQPRGSGDLADTLAIDFQCGTPVELVEMRATVDPLNGKSRDRCGNTITFQVDGFTKQNFLQPPVPNPASASQVRIVVGLDGPQRVTLTIYNDFGDEVLKMLDNDDMPGGIAELNASVGSLPQGVYHLQMRTSSGTSISQKLLIAR